MSRTLRIVLTTLGGVAIFGVFALAGWGAASLIGDDPSDQDTLTMLRYPIVPETDEVEETLEWMGEEQDQTAIAMSDLAEADTESGDPAAGGHSARIVPSSAAAPPELDDTTTTSAISGSDGPADEGIPAEVFTEAPYLRGLVDLSEVVIADPVGPLDIDICAGPERLPETPAGCPIGFGGIIVPLGHDSTPHPPSVGGRPPTGFTAFGTDTLYVRAFRRSSVAESIRVEAAEWSDEWSRPGEACEPSADLGASGPIFPVSTIPIDTSDPATWPYDPDFDTLEVYALGLAEGTDYAICTSWVDSSGVGGVVSFWEWARVVTASARRISISVAAFDSVNLNPVADPIEDIDFLEVRVACGGGLQGASLDWPGVGWFAPQDPPVPLCELDGVSGVVQNGGVRVILNLGYEDTSVRNATSEVWLDIDRSDIFCRTGCTDSYITGFALPDIEHELVDPGGRGAIPPTLYRAGRIGLLVEFDGALDDRHGWTIGVPTSFDTSDRIVERPPVLTSFIMGANTTLYPLGDSSFATQRNFILENDVPVSVRAELVDTGFPTSDGLPCVPGGGASDIFESTAPATLHYIWIRDLCLGKDYDLRVTAVSEAGVEYFLREHVSAGDGANVFPFNTLSRTGPARTMPRYTFTLYAELMLGPQAGGACYLLGDLARSGGYVYDAVSPIDNSRASSSSIDEWDAARWGQSSTQPRYVSGGSSSEPSPPITFQVVGAEAQEIGNTISVSIDRALPDRSCTGRRLTSDFTEDLGLSAALTLTELLGGVTITNGTDDYPRLSVVASRLAVVLR